MNAQQLKNAILQEAIEGRLVPQDPNDEPASALLQRIRAEKERLVKEGKLKKKDLVETPISEDEKPFDIPESWIWVRLFDIYNFIDYRGSTPNKINCGIPLVTAKNVKRGYNDYTIKDFISKEEFELRKSRGISKRGDILFTTEAPLGNVSLADLDVFSAGQRLITLQAYSGDNVNNKLMMLFMLSNSFMQSLLEKKTGTTVAGIKASKLKDVLIPLPPLAEQKRIVAKIEELLPKVEEYGKAQEALDKLNEELPERLKKSILQEAIEGRLVPQDPNDEPASTLLQHIRAEKEQLVKEGKLKKKDLVETPISEDEIPFDIPESWEWCKLGTIAALIGGFAFKSHEYTSSGSRVIRISDITENGFINKNVVRFPFTDKLSQYVIVEGDILMAMTGGTVGKSLYVRYLPEENMLLNQRVALIRPNIVFTDYIDYVIKSQHIQGIITEAKNSTNDNISMGDLYNFPIPLPPLAEQKRIVAKIEEVFKEIDKLKK